MKIFECETLEKTINKFSKEFSKKNIHLSVNKCFKGCVTYGGSISIFDITNNTDFFNKCIVPAYKDLITMIYESKWSINVSDVDIWEDKVYIIVKILGKLI